MRSTGQPHAEPRTTLYYVIGILITLIACTEEISFSKAKAAQPALRVGMDFLSAMEMTNTAGQPDGISVELAHSLGKHLVARFLLKILRSMD